MWKDIIKRDRFRPRENTIQMESKIKAHLDDFVQDLARKVKEKDVESLFGIKTGKLDDNFNYYVNQVKKEATIYFGKSFEVAKVYFTEDEEDGRLNSYLELTLQREDIERIYDAIE